MSFLHLTKKDLLVSIRDKESWLILILMPIVLTLIFSAVFGGDNENMSFFPISIGVVNHDQPGPAVPGLTISSYFLESLQSEELQELLTVTRVENEAELQQQIKDGTLEAGIVLPQSFTTQLTGSMPAESPAEVQVIGDPGSTLISGIVQQIVDGFLTMLEANRIRLQATMTVLAENQTPPQRMQQVMAELMANPATQLPIQFTPQVEGGKQVMSMSQYYGAAMAVMFLLFTGNMGIFSILEERTYKTIGRLKTGHLSKFSLLFGKFLLVLIMGVAQLSILILFTRIVLKIEWGNSLPGLILITLAGTSAVAALSIFIAGITRSAKAAGAVNWIAIQVLAFLGGSYIPVNVMPPFLRLISKLTVNGQALQGYVTLMEGGKLLDVLPHSLILLGFGAFFLILGSYLFQYGEEGM